MSEIPLLLLLLLVIAILLRLDFVYYLVYVLAGSYILARWRTGRNLNQLRIVRRYTDHIFLGETVGVDIEIANTSWWPVPWLRCDETSPHSLATGSGAIRQVIALRPKERTRLHYDLVGRRRGCYELGPALLSTGDLFGFAEAHGRMEQRDYLTVYPRVIPLGQLRLTSRSPLGTIKSQQHIFADPARITGVREYRAGDPLRSVDWKNSARVGQLQVKKHEPAVSLTSLIVLEMNTESFGRQTRVSASEWGIVVAASLANHLVGQRQAVGLACNGLDALTGAACWTISPRPGRVHLMRLLEWLARVQTTETPPLADWLPAATVDLAWGATVIIVAPTGDEAICRASHRLLQRGLNPVLVVIESYYQFGVVRERARRLGFTAQMVADERDLRQWAFAAAGAQRLII
ncbi:MAG: DUF58 domain-containing protein [Chloroflexi bacterium]|nr:DUF58 domain-containing protein [Chloroflexota bacterium]